MSYNAILNFILSGRGNGKTFAFKQFGLECDSQVMWIRRYDNDLDDVEKEFMSDLLREGLFEKDSITLEEHRLSINGVVKVYFVSLSLSHKKKSVSYANVDFMVFDEFIETRKGRAYLAREVETFLDLMETVNRLRIDRPEVRAFFLANKISFDNPYFRYWNIKPFEGRFKKFKDGLIVVENYTNETFNTLKKQTKFGRLIEGTRYGEYAIDNKALRDTSDFIRIRPPSAKLKCNIRYEEMYIGLWEAEGGNEAYVCRDYNPNSMTFAERGTLKEGEFILKSRDVPLLWMKNLNAIGRLYFSDILVKSLVQELLEVSFK